MQTREYRTRDKLCEECAMAPVRPRHDRIPRYCSRSCANRATARTQSNRFLITKRFWDKVAKSQDCWQWQGAIANGYGYIYHRGRVMRATHVSWELEYEPVPKGLWVLHRCDNPLCVRPDHLFLGTHKDNMKDRDMKGRTASGERHGWTRKPEAVLRGSQTANAKLTENDVLEIRQTYSQGGTSYRLLGLKYKVDSFTIRAVIKRRTWEHV